MARPICAYIDLSAAHHNLMQVRSMAPHARLMAVVKANGYGHGVERMARGFAHADAFAVASLGEALELRYAGVSHPIVLLEGIFTESELRQAVEYQLDIVVHSHEQVQMLTRVALPAQLTVWLKIDTGMHRLGFSPDQVMSVWQTLLSLPCVAKPIRLMTHFASADVFEDGLNDVQMMRFASSIQAMMPAPVSMANSAAVVNFKLAHRDWIRPGIMLYGATPVVDKTAEQLGLKPVMTLMSEVIAIKSIAKGEYVGYAGSWRAERHSVIAVVAVGYGDGYPRHASVGTPVWINGCYAPLIGRVSMDMITVDITDMVHLVTVGSAVVLWGAQLPVELVAQYADTISYELLCGVTRRVPCIEQAPPL